MLGEKLLANNLRNVASSVRDHENLRFPQKYSLFRMIHSIISANMWSLCLDFAFGKYSPIFTSNSWIPPRSPARAKPHSSVESYYTGCLCPEVPFCQLGSEGKGAIAAFLGGMAQSSLSKAQEVV